MKTAIIIHGLPTKEEYFGREGDSESNCHWLPWLQKQLIVKGILAQTPEMPTAYNPEYSEWKKMIMRFPLNEETILVGHSCGAGFLLRFLSEENIRVGKVVLVAPWIDPNNSLDTRIFDFRWDKNLVEKTASVAIFYSKDDEYMEVKETIEIIEKEVANVKTTTFQNYGHFCLRHMKTREFPELLEECLK